MPQTFEQPEGSGEVKPNPMTSSQSISVIVIGHNEEQAIDACLQALTAQTLTPAEIILVAHNCTDNTISIAKKHPTVTVLELSGPVGQPYARAHGIAHATGEIIACTDADTVARADWLERLTAPLHDEKVSGVGGLVWFSGLIGRWMSFDYFFLTPLTRWKQPFYFWGASMAFRKKDFELEGGFGSLYALKTTLGLASFAEDLYLGLLLMRRGRLVYASRAICYSQSPPLSLKAWIKRGYRQKQDYVKMTNYFKGITQP